jgi:hypothetical protein
MMKMMSQVLLKTSFWRMVVERNPHTGVEVSKGLVDSPKEVSLKGEQKFQPLKDSSKQENQCFLMRTQILKNTSWWRTCLI